MKKLFTLLAGSALAIIISCEGPNERSSTPKPVVVQTENHKAKSIEYITGELHTSGRSIGLYKITLDDGREVLLYNDSKGIAMIQLIK